MMKPYLDDGDARLYCGDVLEVLRGLEPGSAHACVTSPPYTDMRPEYESPTSWRPIFGELMYVCTGPMLWNVGRKWSYGAEQLWWLELVEAATDVGWRHTDTLVWVKPNPNPIQGAVATNAHEYVLAFDQPDHVWNEDARRLPYAEGSVARLRRRWIANVSVKGDTAERNGPRRDDRRGERREPHPGGARAPSYLVHEVGREKGNKHPAPMPLSLARELVCLASRPGQTVIDPFTGSGTTNLACRIEERHSIGIELSPSYCAMAAERLAQQTLIRPQAS